MIIEILLNNVTTCKDIDDEQILPNKISANEIQSYIKKEIALGKCREKAWERH